MTTAQPWNVRQGGGKRLGGQAAVIASALADAGSLLSPNGGLGIAAYGRITAAGSCGCETVSDMILTTTANEVGRNSVV